MLSCVGCKFLYGQGEGYSNYTWEMTTVICSKGRNPYLMERDKEEPSDWEKSSPETDNWSATKASRCELYATGPYITLDVGNEDGPADYTQDQEAIAAICESSGRKPNGY